MFGHMLLQSDLPPERGFTTGTREGLLSRVQPHVCKHVGGDVRLVAANFAKRHGAIGCGDKAFPDALDAGAPHLNSLLMTRKKWRRKKERNKNTKLSSQKISSRSRYVACISGFPQIKLHTH
jgi:hypothetical protein